MELVPNGCSARRSCWSLDEENLEESDCLRAPPPMHRAAASGRRAGVGRSASATNIRRTLAALAHEVSLDDKYNVNFEGRVSPHRLPAAVQ